jgi:hypothetical protein
MEARIYKEEKDERLIMEAKMELSKLEAIKVMALNNDFGCEIHIDNLVLGLCNNKKIIPLVNYQIKEIKKFLKGEKNTWE